MKEFIVLLLLVAIFGFSSSTEASPSPGISGSVAVFSPVLAQSTTTIDVPMEKFLVILGRICLILCVLVVLWAAYHIQQQRVMEAIYCLVGAFILAIAVPLARAVMGIGGWGF